jgi:hypothetical protein
MTVISVPGTEPEGGHRDDERLTPDEVVARWRHRVNKKTLANWRSLGTGPRFTRIGNRILYPLTAIMSYEEKRDYASTKDYGKEKN